MSCRNAWASHDARPGFLLFVTLNLLVTAGLSAADQAPAATPPAGQMCRPGNFVVGFDEQGNIICADGANGAQPPAAAPVAAVERENPGCSAECRSASSQEEPPPVSATGRAAAAVAVAVAPRPVIDEVTPSSVVYGKKEITVSIQGTGFTDATVVRFAGATYIPAVREDGAELSVTLPTADLTIGSYALSVSNGPGLEHTVKRALAVY